MIFGPSNRRAAACAAILTMGMSAEFPCYAVGTTASKTTLAASPASAYVKQSVTLTATVAPDSGNGATPTGTVTFKDASTTLTGCTVALNASGVATCTTTFSTA